MQNRQSYKELQYRYEVLRARMKIREFAHETVAHEIYENVGQKLSLVQMQLAILEPQSRRRTIESISKTIKLVESSIKDLRGMCGSFYLDTYLFNGPNWVDVLTDTVRGLGLNTGAKIFVIGAPKVINRHLIFIIVRMLQEVLISIRTVECECTGIKIQYLPDKMRSVIGYKGFKINFKATNFCSVTGSNDRELHLYARASLIKGNLTVKTTRTGNYRVVLDSPLNFPAYG